MADFSARYGPWALIAGASEGIGASFARGIADRGVNVALVARHPGPLSTLHEEIRMATGVQVRSASVDLTTSTLIDDLAGLVDGIDVGLLVYNAGAVYGAGFFVDRPIDDALHLVYLSCRGPVLLAHHFGSAMAARGRGGIILMTSMGAAAGSAYTAVYNATKAFDLVLAESLWMELGQRGVDVLGVPAGLTDTPAMRRSGVKVDDSPFVPMTADAVAEEALEALGGGGPVHVVGEQNREAAASLWPVPRADLIAGMSAGAASLYGLPVPPTPVVK
jgi:short-subunit dehydrogenase